MKDVTWNNIDNLSSQDISYLLFIEGKDSKTISIIRNIPKIEVEKHIIHCKIKYKIYKYGHDSKSMLKALINCPKDERLMIINSLDKEKIYEIEDYIIENIFNANKKECTFYIWFLGEIKSTKGIDTIITFLKCSDAQIKRMCCSAIGKIGCIKAEDELIKILSEKRLQVKEYAIKALGRIKSKKSLNYLYSIEKNGEKEYIKLAASYAIENIKKGEKSCE